MYNEDVEIIRPRDYVISPSNANYKKTRDLIVESVSGDPFDLLNKTLFQDEFENISKAYAPVSNVQNVSVGILTDTFYKISIDPSFNQNDGSTELLYGNFSVHAKTKIIGEVGAGQTFLDVDSTLGFPKTGTIAFEYNDGTSGVATYSNKTVNQFLGIATDAITGTVLDKSDVDQNTFAYSAGAGSTDGIQVKIRSVLSELSVPSNTYYQKKGSKIKIKSLGKVADHVKSNKWIFNTAPNYAVQSLSLVDASNNTYNLTTKDANILRIGDKLKLEDTAENVLENEFIVTDVFNSKSCLIRGLGISNPNLIAKVTKIISKIDSDLHSDLNQIVANVQNVYVDADKNLVASSSLPYFSGLKLNPTTQKITFSGTFDKDQEIFQITTGVDHNFFTGDAVYYTPQKGSVTTVSSGGESIFQEYVISSLFDEGIYFVDRVDSNRVRLAKSRSNLYNNIFVSVDITNDNVTIQSNTIEKYEFKGKSIKPQKLLREVSNPNDNGNQYHTIPGYTGILVNGVEVLNYKSRNFVYYGQIDSIDVVSGGEGYDVINPPLLNVTDSVGSGATGYCAVKGSVEEIRVLNSGFDYLEVPIVKITGGNGTGATAEAKLATVPHEVTFDASDTGTAISGVGTVGIGSDISTIGFSTYHKFRNGERVVYNTFGRRAISGLSTGAVYYARVNDANTIKLHKSLDDSIVGVNTVSLLDYGDGIHAFNSLNGKAVVNSIKLTNPGFNYENKKRTCSPVGINTALNTININNHGFNNGEIVTYSFEDTSVAGLSTSKNYYVTKINDNSFRLSAVGVGTTVKDFYFKTSQYENLTNSGVGTHNFNYPEIRVEVIGKVGISSVGEETFQAVAQPIVRGEITSIYLTGNGVGYGSSEILNFERYPDINVYSGSSAELTPIIENSKIVDVIVSRPGRGYNSPPNLSVTGVGTGADLIPVIVDGQIKSVKINKSGVGYGMSTTQINVVVPGKDASFKTNLQKWRVNEYRKNYSNITNDDVFISKSINSNFELECSYVYAPRSLRRVLYASDQEGNTLYGKRDLTFVNGIESNIDSHSPIIGWSYDGYPIYGPYAYNQKSGETLPR